MRSRRRRDLSLGVAPFAPYALFIIMCHGNRDLAPAFLRSMSIPSFSSLLSTPSGRTAARHLELFGVESTHLVASETYDPSARGVLAPDPQRFERVVAHVDGLSIPGLNVDAERVVFLFSGTPVPVRGDGLVALTSYWRVEHVVHVDGRGEHALYAALCA